MLVEEVIYLSPETTKLKAAIAMKKAEMGNYAQKFLLPNAKMSLEYGTMYDRMLPYEDSAHNQLKSGTASAMANMTQAETFAATGNTSLAAAGRRLLNALPKSRLGKVHLI